MTERNAPGRGAPIGVFDSGLGGLTAVRELRRILPGEDIVYFGDTGRVPYGTRGVDVIVRYAKQDIAFLLEQNVKYVMAACGTVSSTLSEAYTRTLPVPYTGVVQSAAAAAVRATRTGLIGVIGTPATVKSGSYNAAIAALKDQRFQDLLRWRYMDGWRWERIGRAMGYEQRQVYRLHALALSAFARAWGADDCA